MASNPLGSALSWLPGTGAAQKPQEAPPAPSKQPKERGKQLQHSMAAAVATAAGAYIALRGGINLFHRTRRSFLTALLLEVASALDALGVTWWADFGCLLGITRGGDLILHDNDVDLVVLNPRWPELLEGLRAVLPPKYSLKVVTPVECPDSSWIRVYCPLGMCDLFGAYDEGDTVLVDCGHEDTMRIDRQLVLPTGRKEWRGCQLSVPRDVEGTLVVRYGPTWRTPAYMEKGADTVEGSKPYAKVLKALAKVGIRI